jgi:putative salt-induced outer membrane protein YdiY
VYRYRLKLDGRYRKTDNTVSESKAEMSGEMRRLMHESLWFTSGRLSVLHDDLKDLSYRTKIGPGIGRYLADTEALTADISTGVLYVREKISGEESDYIAWRLSQRVDWQVTEVLKCWVATEFFTDVADSSNYQITFSSGLDNKINSHLSLIVALEDDYDSLPNQVDKIKKNDLEFRTGLRYHF